MNAGRGAYDLGLIIPTREEFDYLRESVPFAPLLHGERGYWYDFGVPGGRRGVAHVLFDMGLTSTTSGASRLLERFDPEVLAVVGIGGGLSADLRLGDVVVGSVIQEYLKAAKAAPDGPDRTAFQPAGAGWPLAERLRNFTNHFRYFCEDCYQQWVRFARIRGVEAELPFATTPGARREPGYFVLPVASGDLVVTDPAFAGWLLSHDRKRAVIEMESAGAARAVQEYDRDVALIVLRGISDFADGRKAELDAVVSGSVSGAWRRYAAGNAIELLFAFLAAPNFPWREPAALPAGPPDADPAISAVEASAAPSARAWDYFMRAARLVEVTAAGAELYRSLHPAHAESAAETHGPGESTDHGHGHGHEHDGSTDHEHWTEPDAGPEPGPHDDPVPHHY
jgi:nucleoside phosphorylase